MQHKAIKHCFNGALRNRWFSPASNVFVTLGLFCFFYFFCSTSVFAEDLLKDAMPALKENFGTGSAVVRIIYLVDIITSVLIYIKTKDYKIAGSVLITLIYLTYTLNNMVFKGIS